MAAAKTIRWAGMRLTMDGAAEFRQNLTDINNRLKTSQAQMDKVTNSFERGTKNTETLTARKEHLENALNLNNDRLTELNQRMEEARTAFGDNSSEVLAFQTEIARTEAAQVDLQRQLQETERAPRAQPWQELGERMEAAGQRVTAVGDRMARIGKGLSVGVTAPLMGIATAAIKVGADFDDNMGTIQARTRMTAEEISELGTSFRNLATSGDYGIFTAREISNAFGQIAVAGDDAEYATEIMRNSMVLATAVGVDLSSAAYFLGNYLLKVGKDASYAEKYINLFAATNQKTGIGLNTLQDYLFRTNASLQTAGISGTEATAVFGRLYQAGIRGAQAYSGMNTVIRDLIEPSDALVGYFEKLGVAAFDIEDANRNALEVLFELSDALDENGDALLRHAVLQELGTEQGTYFADELFTQTNALREMIPELYEITEATNGTGQAFEMAGIQQEGLTGSSKQVRVALEEIMLQISDHLMPHVLRFVDGIGNLVNRFASLDEGTQRNIIRLAGLAAAIGPVVAVGGRLISSVGGIIIKMSSMNKAIAAARLSGEKLTGSLKLYKSLQTAFIAKKTKFIAFMKAKAASWTLLNVAIQKTTLGWTLYSSKIVAFRGKMLAFSAALKAKAAGMGLLSGALLKATAGFIKLAAAMIANPIGLAIAGVALLVGGIIALVSAVNRTSEEHRAWSAETENLIKRQQQLRETIASNREQFEQTTRQLEIHSEYVQDLGSSILDLAGKQNLSLGEMVRLENKIKELNESVPNLNLAFDEQTGVLNMSAEALQKYLNIAENEARQNELRKETLNLRREQAEIETELREIALRQLETQERIDEGLYRGSRERRDLLADLENLQSEKDKLNDLLEVNAELYEDLNYSIETTSGAIQYYENALNSINETGEEVQNSIDGVTEAMGRQAISAEEWERLQSDALNKIESSFNRYKRTATDAFSRVSENTAISVAQMTDNLLHNARAVEDWSKNIAILAERGLDEGLIEQLRQAGPEAAAQVRNLVYAADDELELLNYAFGKGTRVSVESMQRELDPTGVAQSAGELIDHVANAILENESMGNALINTVNKSFNALDETINTIGFDRLGSDTVDGYVQGIDSQMGAVETAGQVTGHTYERALKSELEQNSPSRVTERIGIGAVDGLIKGTSDRMPQAENIARKLAKAFINNVANTINSSRDIDNSIRNQIENIRRTADQAVNSMNFNTVGAEIANGVARGIGSGNSIVSNAATSMISSSLAAMRSEAQINSPSKKFENEIGRNLVLGLVRGITRNVSLARNASIVMARTVYESSKAYETRTTAAGERISNNFVNAFGRRISGIPAIYRNAKQETLRAIEVWGISEERLATERAEVLKSIETLSLKDSIKLLEERRKQGEFSAFEEITLLEYVLKNHELTAQKRIEIENQLSEAQNQMRAASFEHSRNWIEKQLELGKMTAQEEIEAWERVVNRHVEGSEERLAAEEMLATRRDELNRQQMNALQEMERLEQAYIQAVDNRTQALLNTFDMFREINLSETNVDRSRDAILRAEQAYASAREELERIKQSMANANDSSENMARYQERLVTAQNNVQEAHETLTAAIEDGSRSQAQVMADNLQGQIENMQAWEVQMNKLSERGIEEGLLEHFRRMGPTSIRYLEQLNQSSDTELTRLSNLYRQKHEEARRLAVNELQGLRQETNQQIEGILSDLTVKMSSQSNPIGINMIQGIIQGAKNKSGDLYATLQNIAGQALQAAKNTLGINSPSRAFRNIGLSIGDGLIIGLKSKMQEIVDTCKRIAEMSTESLYIDTKEIMQNSKAALQSMQAALPSLEKDTQHIMNPQNTSTNAAQQVSFSINMNGTYNIREDADIEKLANEVIKKLDRETKYKSRLWA